MPLNFLWWLFKVKCVFFSPSTSQWILDGSDDTTWQFTSSGSDTSGSRTISSSGSSEISGSWAKKLMRTQFYYLITRLLQFFSNRKSYNGIYKYYQCYWCEMAQSASDVRGPRTHSRTVVLHTFYWAKDRTEGLHLTSLIRIRNSSKWGRHWIRHGTLQCSSVMKTRLLTSTPLVVRGRCEYYSYDICVLCRNKLNNHTSVDQHPDRLNHRWLRCLNNTIRNALINKKK